jgi:hypothetical protein
MIYRSSSEIAPLDYNVPVKVKQLDLNFTNMALHSQTLITSRAVSRIEENMNKILQLTGNLNKDAGSIDLNNLNTILKLFKGIEKDQAIFVARLDRLENEKGYASKTQERQNELIFLKSFQERLQNFMKVFNDKYSKNLENLEAVKRDLLRGILSIVGVVALGIINILARVAALIFISRRIGGKTRCHRKKSKKHIKTKRRTKKRSTRK